MSDVRILSGNQPTDALVMVSADQETIVGNGTTADPIRAAAALGGFRFVAAVANISPPILGLACSGASEISGHTRVAPGDARPVGGSGRQICGFVIDVLLQPDFRDALLQCGGIVTLDEDAWAVVTADSLPLRPGSAYYLVDAVATPIGGGRISRTPPATSGAYKVLVGVAISSTQMLASCVPSVVFRNP